MRRTLAIATGGAVVGAGILEHVELGAAGRRVGIAITITVAIARARAARACLCALVAAASLDLTIREQAALVRRRPATSKREHGEQT
jgi:hypothetical protein